MKEPLKLTLEVTDQGWKVGIDPGLPDNDLYPAVVEHVRSLAQAIRDCSNEGTKWRWRRARASVVGESQGDMAR